MNFFFSPGEDQSTASGQDFDITASKKEYGQNELVNITVKNNTDFKAIIKNECPNEPLDVSKKVKGQWTEISHSTETDCEKESDYTINPDEEITIKYDSWNHFLFGELGT